jgi:hypothetical protein
VAYERYLATKLSGRGGLLFAVTSTARGQSVVRYFSHASLLLPKERVFPITFLLLDVGRFFEYNALLLSLEVCFTYTSLLRLIRLFAHVSLLLSVITSATGQQPK